MTKHDDRKDAVRARMERTGEKYTVAMRVLETRPRLMLPLPEVVVGSDACPVCSGKGFGDTAFELGEPEANAVLVCLVFCSQCRGCGRRRHDVCSPQQHDDPEEFGYDPYDDEDQDEDDGDGEELCHSCRGRRWWAMQGFDETDVYYIRVPCGCSADLLVAAP